MVAATFQRLAALLVAVSACLCLASSALAQAPSPAPLPFVRNERLAAVLSEPATAPIWWVPYSRPLQPAEGWRPADYPEPPNWSRLVFQSYRDRNWEIYASNEEGGGMQRLTYRAASDARPKFNHLARRIVFESNVDDNWDIWVMNADGTGMTQLTHGKAVDAMPEWSPDGTEIVFTSDRTGNPELFVMQPDGSNVRQLTFEPGADTDATWSSAGEIAWVRSYGPDSTLMLMRADGSNQHMLAGPLFLVSDLVWDSDGKFLAYALDNDADGFTEMEVLSPTQGWRTALTSGTDCGTCDLLPGGWFTVGTRFFFSQFTYILYKGHYYIETASINGYQLSCSDSTRSCSAAGGNAISSARDAFVAWETADLEPPQLRSWSSLGAWLPALPYSFHFEVFNPGMGQGGDLTVQYKIGADTTWEKPHELLQVWLQDTPGPFQYAPDHLLQDIDMLQGKSAYWRARACDAAYNCTLVYLNPMGTRFYNLVYAMKTVDNYGLTVVPAQVDVTAFDPLDHLLSGAGHYVYYYSFGELPQFTFRTPGARPLTISYQSEWGYEPSPPERNIVLPPADDLIAGGALSGTQMLNDSSAAASQVVTLPLDMHRPTLSFQHLAQASTSSGRVSFLQVTIDDGTTSYTEHIQPGTGQGDQDWYAASLPLDAWAGKTITVTFAYTATTTDGSAPPGYTGVTNVSLGSWRTAVVSEVVPSQLPAAAPFTLHIRGTNFIDLPSVSLGDIPASQVTRVAEDELAAEFDPITTPGRYRLTVANAGGLVMPLSLVVGQQTYLPHVLRE